MSASPVAWLGGRRAGSSAAARATTLDGRRQVSIPYATVEDEEEVATAEAAAPELEQWRQPLRRSLRETWDSRHVLRPMAAYALPDYAQTHIGRWWLFLRPGLPLVAYTVVFAGIFGAKAPNGIPYLVFLLFGMQGWSLFQYTVIFETRSFQRLGKFARNLNVPLLFLPTASVVRTLVNFCVYAVFGVAALVYYVIADHHLYLQVGPRLLAGVAGWILCVLFGWAVGLFTAALNARVQDVRFTLPVFMQFWLFVTPVVYPLEQVPHRFQPLALANPLTALMELVKYGFLDAGEIRPLGLAWSLVATVLTALFGLLFFNRYARPSPRRAEFDDEEDELA
jgi:homopolymeric O-antigen transport system permease protein